MSAWVRKAGEVNIKVLFVDENSIGVGCVIKYCLVGVLKILV